MPTDAPTITALLDNAIARAKAIRHLPESTYRVQFHKGFTFKDATAIVPYLAQLGVTHLYASPYLKAVPGSTHGYDVIDHSTLNPEVGTPEDYEQLVATLKQHGIHQLLDTVPNHVGVATNENKWWNDVLENGRASIYGNFFDITWRGSPRVSLHDRVLLPILGGSFGDVLEKGELKLGYENGAFFIDYWQRRFPISPKSYGKILTYGIASLQLDDPTLRAFEQLLAEANALAHTASPQRHQQKEQVKEELDELVASSEKLQQFIEKNLAVFNGTPGDAASFDLLADLLEQQAYRLAYWKTAPDEINYRRFFDVNDLAAITMERPEVFKAAHEFTLKLLTDEKITGLRIDHPDGLYDPDEYLRRLQQHYLVALAKADYQGDDWADVETALLEQLEQKVPSLGDATADRWPLYVLGEKILAMDEPLPQDWALHGTSGYDFLNMCNGLFVDTRNAQAFDKLYHAWTGDYTSFDDLAYQKKKLILERSLASELHMLTLQLDRLAQRDRRSQDFTVSTLQAALRELIACFPVYRSYITQTSITDVDRTRIQQSVDKAKQKNPKMEASVFDFIQRTLLLEFGERFTDADRAEQRHFAGKFQQLTSPTTAKGIEDTTFYLYNRLLSLNEVGGEPSHFGLAVHDVHRYFSDRQRDWPFAMSTLSTHDTKRSEDVRARINVLSEIPEEWAAAVKRWSEMNVSHRKTVDGHPSPNRNEEYAIYQTLLGAWPMPGASAEEYAEFIKRVQAYLTKAMREAKQHTTWTDSNEAHESAVTGFVAAICDRAKNVAFITDFEQFQRRINHLGLFNSLSQSLVKLTAPGVPDTYQGTDLWDFSLVDPDNRRPVDYAKRRELLAKLPETPNVSDLLASKNDGRIKLHLHRQALRLRKQYPGLFTQGEYLPLSATGPHAENVFAFARRHGGKTAILVVGRLLASVTPSDDAGPVGNVWAQDRLAVPFDLPSMRNALTGQSITKAKGLVMSDVFKDLPIALLISE